MRICIVTREFPPITSYSGGIGRQFARLAAELARQGHETHVLTVADAGSGSAREWHGVHVHPMPLPRPRGALARSRALLGRTLQVDRALEALGPFDVVYSAEWAGETWRYSMKKRSGPLVTNLASSLAQLAGSDDPGSGSAVAALRTGIQRRLERGQTRRSDAIVAPTEAALRYARELWDIEGIPSTVLPNMVDIAEIRRLATMTAPTGDRQSGPVIAFFGRLERNKGVDVLIHAMSAVWQRFPHADLKLIGRDGKWNGGTTSSHLRALAGDHSHRLQILGERSPEELYPTLSAADVVVLPSRWESFSLAALESMAIGKPTVVSSAGGLGALVRDGVDGMTVPPGDAGELGDAVVQLLEDPELRGRLGRSAAERAEQYDVATVTSRHVSYFEGLGSATR